MARFRSWIPPTKSLAIHSHSTRICNLSSFLFRTWLALTCWWCLFGLFGFFFWFLWLADLPTLPPFRSGTFHLRRLLQSAASIYRDCWLEKYRNRPLRPQYCDALAFRTSTASLASRPWGTISRKVYPLQFWSWLIPSSAWLKHHRWTDLRFSWSSCCFSCCRSSKRHLRSFSHFCCGSCSWLPCSCPVSLLVLSFPCRSKSFDWCAACSPNRSSSEIGIYLHCLSCVLLNPSPILLKDCCSWGWEVSGPSLMSSSPHPSWFCWF